MADQIQATASSLEALSRQYELITSNLANANTAAYKRRTSAFAQALNQQLAGEGDSGVVKAATGIDFSQGGLVETGRPLDLGLDGEGFFVLETPNGELYTRNGTFRLNAAGQLVDAVGRLVAGEDGPVTIPPEVDSSQLSVAQDGTICAAGKPIGKVKVVAFSDNSVLMPAGGSCFKASGTTAPQPAGAKVQQRHQEISNVSVVQELVGLIAVTRLYEANLKTINVQDERTKNILQVAMA